MAAIESRLPVAVLGLEAHAQNVGCRFSFILALFAFQEGTLAQRVPMPGRNLNDRDSKSNRAPSIVGVFVESVSCRFVRREVVMCYRRGDQGLAKRGVPRIRTEQPELPIQAAKLDRRR